MKNKVSKKSFDEFMKVIKKANKEGRLNLIVSDIYLSGEKGVRSVKFIFREGDNV
jgi:hypothetical protein